LEKGLSVQWQFSRLGERAANVIKLVPDIRKGLCIGKTCLIDLVGRHHPAMQREKWIVVTPLQVSLGRAGTGAPSPVGQRFCVKVDRVYHRAENRQRLFG
jgi:hypothetical protein